MKIAVIGSGYVGLVAGACFAEAGTEVVCVDVDEAKLEKLRRGDVPFFEPGLSEMVRRNWPDRLTFSSNLEESIQGCQAVFIAVGTPPQEDGSADLTHVLGVARDVARLAKHRLTLVLKSTVPVGTNKKVRQVVAEVGEHALPVVSNPEFLKEGDAISDFAKPDRIVIGTDDDEAFETLQRLYAPFNRQRDRLQRMSPESAEIVKYASNALLATKISFMNEIAKLCDVAGGDVEDVRIAVGSDRRIGFPFLYPGLGFGGSCFPKDTRALVRTGDELGAPMGVVRAAMLANAEPVKDLLRVMEESLGGLSGKTIAVWGLSFKPKTDDVREAPALDLITELTRRGASVRAADPQALATAKESLEHRGASKGVLLTSDLYEAASGADALVVATEWGQFRSPNTERLAQVMRGRLVFDGRNCLVPESFVDAGFRYKGIGRPWRAPA
ncbi:MAG: UDP-glucose/GDP-mannose dehydrogenase family protein [Polyangiaceae bacterium]|nr:UDP-glucose/GDP-mannose dehydrogenase family protein [Polyangiaceae bacterium]MCW5790237.1 UDP-glucose/GDP-mannose dehydrogenase family protein [Polyangiaceae bacterium]